MIVADTSAFAAILFLEADADRYARVIASADRVVVPAPTLLELRLILQRKLGSAHLSDADRLLDAPSIEVVPWTATHVPLAVDALRRFGGRPARLNFGDCMVYAVARLLDAPLLYKGEDFARTDVRSAL